MNLIGNALLILIVLAVVVAFVDAVIRVIAAGQV